MNAEFDGCKTQPMPLAAAQPDEAVLNSAELLQRCMGNVDLADRVLRRFVDMLPQELSQLEQLAGAGEPLRAAAHRLKGAAANIAAGRIRSGLEQLEAVAANEAGEQEVAAVIERLTADMGQLMRQLPDWRN